MIEHTQVGDESNDIRTSPVAINLPPSITTSTVPSAVTNANNGTEVS
ncbi:hypothetical protein ACFTAO_33985 [Paenibacillus rhizoplanae]